MPQETCRLTDLQKALHRFAFPSGSTQTSQHIKPLHWYTACRLVIEGGFHPDQICPHPPFAVNGDVLHHDPSSGGTGERTIIGGLKTKKIDVSVCIDGIGPVLAISLKGTHNAFRNLTNRMEEAAGDCTNLHLSYPALVYGFWHVLRGNDESDASPLAHFKLEDGRYTASDIAITAAGSLGTGVERYAAALARLSERDDLRDHPSSYEACGLTLVNVCGEDAGCVHPLFPKDNAVLDYNHMFRRLYELYDRRFVYQAPSLGSRTRRNEWNPESPLLEHTVMNSPSFREMRPRVAEK